MSTLESNSSISSLDPTLRAILVERAELAEELQRRIQFNRLRDYKPYAKQAEFHGAGKDYRERLLMAGNQLGKTYCGAAEMAIHLTGLYPEWWDGRRWDRPIRAWAASETSEVTRDGVQRLLVGEPMNKDLWGSGAIPKANLGETRTQQGVANSIASVTIKHVTGGWSSLGFRSYVQGREKFQGESLDVVWLDEEPPEDVYFEALTRTNATGGMLYMTFTPLKGMSTVVMRFLGESI